MTTENNSNKKKRFNRVIIYLFMLLLVVSVLFFYYIYFIQTQEHVLTSSSDKSEFEVLEGKIDGLNSILDKLDQSGDAVKKEVMSLKEKICNTVVSGNKEQIIRIALDIQNDIKNFKSYDQNLDSLKGLLSSTSMRDNIFILDENKGHNITENKINDDFTSELNVFLDKINLLNEHKSRFVNFLSNFVIIRNKRNDFIEELQSAITRRDYKTVQRVLSDDSDEHFKKTLTNVSLHNLLNDSINNIIIYLVGGVDG
ncbi:MAG: hypothetical protein LBC92_01555 [Rickettsiales bacterium]|jgi:hypothetical protein|nr:hypothetical protein [Rickettsiales bacterium]